MENGKKNVGNEEHEKLGGFFRNLFSRMRKQKNPQALPDYIFTKFGGIIAFLIVTIGIIPFCIIYTRSINSDVSFLIVVASILYLSVFTISSYVTASSVSHFVLRLIIWPAAFSPLFFVYNTVGGLTLYILCGSMVVLASATVTARYSKFSHLREKYSRATRNGWYIGSLYVALGQFPWSPYTLNALRDYSELVSFKSYAGMIFIIISLTISGIDSFFREKDKISRWTKKTLLRPKLIRTTAASATESFGTGGEMSFNIIIFLINFSIQIVVFTVLCVLFGIWFFFKDLFSSDKSASLSTCVIILVSLWTASVGINEVCKSIQSPSTPGNFNYSLMFQIFHFILLSSGTIALAYSLCKVLHIEKRNYFIISSIPLYSLAAGLVLVILSFQASLNDSFVTYTNSWMLSIFLIFLSLVGIFFQPLIKSPNQ